MKHPNFTLILALVVFVSATSAKAGFTIAKSGTSRCTIIEQADATIPEQNAAKELASYLQTITGGSFIIRSSTELTNAPKNAIIVGPGSLAQSLFPDVNLDQLGPEEFVIRTKDSNLLLAGGRSRGTLYAVYRFLQDQCGVRWWTPWATNVPHQATLANF